MEELGAFAHAVDAIRPWLGQLVVGGDLKAALEKAGFTQELLGDLGAGRGWEERRGG